MRWLLILIAFLVSCSGNKETEREALNRTEQERNATLIAQVNDRAITRERFQTSLTSQPPAIRDALRGIGGMRRYLQDMVRFELLLQEADRRGLNDDPVVQNHIRQRLAEALLERVDSEVGAGDVSEDDVIAYFEAHRAELIDPPRVTFIRLLSRDPRRAQRLRLIWSIVASNIRTHDDLNARFEAFASATTADATASPRIGPISLDEAGILAPESVIQAALERPTQRLGAPITTTQGTTLIWPVEHTPRRNLSLTDARPLIRQRLVMQRRQQARRARLDQVRDRTTIQILDPALELHSPSDT